MMNQIYEENKAAIEKKSNQKKDQKIMKQTEIKINFQKLFFSLFK